MSAVAIGFDRELRGEWLDLTATLAASGASRQEAHDVLHDRLRDQLEGREAVEKTVLVLLRVWYPGDGRVQSLRDQALPLLPTASADERLAMHWGTLLAVYPFFRDTAAMAGRLLRLQPAFDARQLRQRLVERYGDRAIVERARRHVVRSLTWWDVLAMVSRSGVYRQGRSISLHHQEVERVLLHALLLASGASVAPSEGLLSSPELFPFELAHDVASVARDPRFTTSTVAGRMRVVSLAG